MAAAFQFPRSTPESQGVDSGAILHWIEEIEKKVQSLHSFMLVRHGKVIAEGWWYPYAAQHPHMLFSLSKSYTSTAVGMAIAEGYFSLEDSVISFFPEETPAEVSPNLTAMKVKHLLSMNTGHSEDTTASFWQNSEGNWVKAFLAQPVTHEPGSHFLYNTGATYMLSAIVQKTTGQKLIDYLKPRLFEPLGIENPTWQECPRGINTGGFGLNVRTEDIARFGQLYLQRGEWQGKTLLSSEWIAQATSTQSDNLNHAEPNLQSDWQQGYGFQFWRCRHNSYRGDGAFGQYCVVMPDQDTVLAITSGLGDMQVPLDLVWDILLPAMHAEALPDNSEVQAKLTAALGSLNLPVSVGSLSSALETKISGKTFVYESEQAPVQSIHFDFQPQRCIVTTHDKHGEHQLDLGRGEWLLSETDAFEEPALTAGCITWKDESTLEITVYAYTTPFCYTNTCRFGEETVSTSMHTNVSFMPEEQKSLLAHIA